MGTEMLWVNGSFPRAFVHIDGDAFFTSVEQSMNPSLKGKAVVTGQERGIIACASYEAKALGIKRGVSLWEARKICPKLIILPSDYESYSLYSKRMFEIMRRFTPTVEEYSIDEGFADLTGLRRVHRMPYEQIARTMQQTIHEELDLTVSVGLSLSKGLCKIASDFRKPHGFTAVRGRHIPLFLERVATEDVWGLGPSSVQMLAKYGVHTAYDFVQRPEKWIDKLLHKPGREIWHELRGKSLLPVDPEPKQTYQSIGKGKTFSSPSRDTQFIYAKLVRNVEAAFTKLRRHQHRTAEIYIALRYSDYRQQGLGVRLNRATDSTQEILPVVRGLFDQAIETGKEYRATQVWLTRLESADTRQLGLFDNQIQIERYKTLSTTIDEINARFGKHKVAAATALTIQQRLENSRTRLPWRKLHLLEGENNRQRLYLPRLNIAV
jgi:DNA polymerase-4/DNA polymerase V